MRRDPQTDTEWQEAVDAAHGALALDAARQYGLVMGGPVINAARCDEIIRRGAQRGVRASPDAVERFVAAMNGGKRSVDGDQD